MRCLMRGRGIQAASALCVQETGWQNKLLLLTLVFPSCHLTWIEDKYQDFCLCLVVSKLVGLASLRAAIPGAAQGDQFKIGGGFRGKVKRWDSRPIPGCGHRISSTHCHSFQVKCWELAALPCPWGLLPLTRPEFLVATKWNIDFMLG